MNSNLHVQSVGEIIVSAAGMFSVLENITHWKFAQKQSEL